MWRTSGPAFALLLGDAGVGKTAFAAELAKRLVQLGVNVHLATVPAPGTGKAGHSALEPLVGTPQGPMVRAFGDGLRSVARGRPTAVILDDLHLAEHDLLDALEYATLGGEPLPLWVLGVAAPRLDDQRLLTIVADLVRQNHEHRSIAALLRQNLHLLTRRIVECNAETGEHYLARSRSEYFTMLRSALGGGALTGFTTIVKLLLAKLAFAGFFKGVAFSLNYAGSFVAIQLSGFTLATKQPAATAAALAQRMGELRDDKHMEALVDEIVCLVRSQTAAIAGNLLAVIPATLLLHWGWMAVTGHAMLDEEKAHHIVGSISALSGAWPFAVFTGVLLWLSSVFAAWADNWFALHELRASISEHRRLQHLFGPSRAVRLACWLERNIAGLAGNISLGFMLGMIPEIAGFFSAPLDVRHVTLSTGQFTAALSVLGVGGIGLKVWLASAVGILGIGMLNLLVSFGLALFVATRARNVHAPERGLLRWAVLRRLRQEPFSFILPVGRAVAQAAPGHTPGH